MIKIWSDLTDQEKTKVTAILKQKKAELANFLLNKGSSILS